MSHELYNILNDGHKKVAVLIDPDKMNREQELLPLIEKIEVLQPSFIFIGGSTVDPTDFETGLHVIKKHTNIPVIIFPGSSQQVSAQADGILFLSLISGRNPDFLIGHQVESAHAIKKMNIEVIPTGYLLIDGGKTSSVSYVSQTTPIPFDQTRIAVNTAIAGEMLGLKAIFMDAGSGANNTVSDQMIRAVKENTNVPLIIGGGIKTTAEMQRALGAGADLVVIGNRIEEDTDFLLDIKLMMQTAAYSSN